MREQLAEQGRVNRFKTSTIQNVQRANKTQQQDTENGQRRCALAPKYTSK